MSHVSAGVVNLQVWQLIGLFSTGTELRNTWQPAAYEGCIGMIVEWSKSCQSVQQILPHLSQIDSWWGMNLGVGKVDLRVSLRSSVIQRPVWRAHRTAFTSRLQAAKETCCKTLLKIMCILYKQTACSAVGAYYHQSSVSLRISSTGCVILLV